MIAYVFATHAEAASALLLAEAEIRVVAAEKGFTVTQEGYVIGKNVATGEDVPTAITTKWSDVIQFTDGTFGFPSLRSSFPTTWQRIELVANLNPPSTVEIQDA